MGDDLIRDYLSELDTALAVVPGWRQARVAIITEVGDGLADAVADHLDHGCPPVQAAGRAIDEFGSATLVAAQFVPILAATQVHRCALTLLRTGPLVGALWLATALLTKPLWLPIASPVATVAGIMVAVALVAAVPCTVFAVTVTGRGSHRWSVSPIRATTTAQIATGGAVLTDLVALIAISTQVPAVLTEPSSAVAGTGIAGVAALASLLRLAFTTVNTIRLHRTHTALTTI